jgi:hypothetical protein
MKKILLISLSLFVITMNLYSFETLLFKPLTANHLESRIGSFIQSIKDKLRLDIGHSLDLMELINNENYELRAGGDFFILSRLRSEGKFKFPVETSDFFFGLNLTGNILDDYSFRMRIAHISSHLVDGYTINNQFIQMPLIYSREFIDLVFAYNTKYIRPYIGGTAIFSTIPKNIGRFVPQLGIDAEHSFSKYFNFIAGYDFKLIAPNKNENYLNCHSIQLGLKYKMSENTGLSFNCYYYAGASIHGMFYDNKEDYAGFGIQFHY